MIFIVIWRFELIERYRSTVKLNKMKYSLKIIFVLSLILLAYSSPLSQDDDDEASPISQTDDLSTGFELSAESSAESTESAISEWATESASTSTSTTAPTTRSTTTRRPRPTLPRPTRPPRPLIDAMVNHLQNVNSIFTALSSFITGGIGSLGNLLGFEASGNIGSSSASGSLSLDRKVPIIEPVMDELPTFRVLKDNPNITDLNYLPDLNENEIYIYRFD